MIDLTSTTIKTGEIKSVQSELKFRTNRIAERFSNFNLEPKNKIDIWGNHGTVFFSLSNERALNRFKKTLEEQGVFVDRISKSNDKSILSLPVPLELSDKKFRKYPKSIERAFGEIHQNKNKVVKKIYGKNIEEILELNGLNHEINYLPNNFVFNDNQSFEPNSVVVGGPCINRCEQDVKNLGLNVYVDILTPISLSIMKNLPCYIYIDTPIEFYQKKFEDFESNEEFQGWVKTAEKVEDFIYNLCDFSGVKNIKVIRRDKFYPLLDKLKEQFEVKTESLFHLYNLVPSKKQDFVDEWSLLEFKRVITAYQPLFFETIGDTELDRVFVVESLSQIKAVQLAANFDSRVTPLMYIDTPSKSGNNRMHRSRNGSVSVFSDVASEIHDGGPEFQQYLEQIDLEFFFDKFNVSSFVELVPKLKRFWNDSV